MKAMKISAKKILCFLILLVVLTKLNFFYLGITPGSAVLPITIVATFLFSLVCCKNKIAIIHHDMKYAVSYYRFSLVAFLLVFIYTLIAFPSQGITSTISIALPYFSLLLFYPFVVYMLYQNDTKNIYNLLNLIVAIWYIIVIVQSIVYLSTGKVFLINYFVSWASTRNNGLIRINLFEFGNLMILYNFYEFYTANKQRNRLMNGFMFFIGLLSLIFIQQTRMYYIAIFICLLVIALLTGKNKTNKSIRNITIIILGVLFFASTDIIPNFIESFSLESHDAFSTSNRIFEIKYYLNYFCNHPIFGMGFAHSHYYPTIVRSSTQMAATSDVGIVGQLAKIGIFFIPIYIAYCGRIIYILSKLKRLISHNQYVWHLTLTTYVIVTSFTLIIFDQDRFLLYPFILAICEFDYYKAIQNKNKEFYSHNNIEQE